MTIQRNRLALLALGLALAAPGCAGRIGVIAFEEPGTSCLVVKKPKKIVVHTKGFDEKFLGMAWVIHNACADPQTVTISPIKKGDHDVLTCAAGLEVTVPKGEVRVIACVVKPTVNNESTQGTYVYSIKRNGSTVDPDLIIKRK